jgi:hypothetical protein
MSKIVGRTVKKSDDGVSSDIGQPVLAAVLRSLKPGESVDVYTEAPPTPVTQTAQELGPKPTNFYEHGIGVGRAPGVPQFTTRLVSEPAGTPGYGKTSAGPMATTYRGDSFASGLDGRVNGSDEGSTMTFGPETKQPAATNPEPSPNKDTDAGGPIKKGARRDD